MTTEITKIKIMEAEIGPINLYDIITRKLMEAEILGIIIMATVLYTKIIAEIPLLNAVSRIRQKTNILNETRIGLQVIKVLNKTITVEAIILTIIVEVVLVMTTAMKGPDLTAPALTAVRKIPLLASNPIMEITTIILYLNYKISMKKK